MPYSRTPLKRIHRLHADAVRFGLLTGSHTDSGRCVDERHFALVRGDDNFFDLEVVPLLVAENLGRCYSQRAIKCCERCVQFDS